MLMTYYDTSEEESNFIHPLTQSMRLIKKYICTSNGNKYIHTLMNVGNIVLKLCKTCFK